MSAEKGPVQQLPRLQLGPNECLVVGRVEHISKREDVVYTRVICPAPDTFTAPSTVEIASKGRLGQIGDDVKIHCRVAGYKKNGLTTDGDRITFVNMRLVAVE